MKKYYFLMVAAIGLCLLTQTADAKILIKASPEVDTHDENDHDHSTETQTQTNPTFPAAPTFSQPVAAPVYYRTPVSNYVPAPAPAYIAPPAPVYYPNQNTESKNESQDTYRKKRYTREIIEKTYSNTKKNSARAKTKNQPTYQAPSYAKTSVYTYTRTFANDSYQRTLEPESYRSSDEIYTYQPEAVTAYTRVYVPDTYYYTYQ